MTNYPCKIWGNKALLLTANEFAAPFFRDLRAEPGHIHELRF
jgi:hypothetical protein